MLVKVVADAYTVYLNFFTCFSFPMLCGHKEVVTNRQPFLYLVNDDRVKAMD